MAIREVLTSFTFEQQRQMINLIGADVGDASTLLTPTNVLVSGINEIVNGDVDLINQTHGMDDGTLASPSLFWDSGQGFYKVDANKIGLTSSLSITGNLGKVMKESATIALEYIKSHSVELNIDLEKISKNNIHIHVPEGATPKDGPSAGITMLTSLVSLLTQMRTKSKLAMTGEITLRGKVLPVGGIKEKILAAKRAKIKEIILSSYNKKNVAEIDQSYLTGLKFHYVSSMKEVLDIAITNQKVLKPKW